MKLRIHRTYAWQPIFTDPGHASRIMIGWHTETHKLVATDVLEYNDDTCLGWKPVPIVEDEKPPHPNEKKS